MTRGGGTKTDAERLSPGRAACSVSRAAGLWICRGSEGFDRTWITDASTCKQVLTGGVGKLSFAKDADIHGSGFIYEKNRRRGKIATCVVKTQKEDGDVLPLITSCSINLALATVQFSLKCNALVPLGLAGKMFKPQD
jgi:hypothetical protein